MYEKKDFIAIGNQVEVELEKIQDRLSEKLERRISNNPTGLVFDYKLTDGQGIGFLVKLKDGTTTWFFQDEIKKIGSESQPVNFIESNNKKDQIKFASQKGTDLTTSQEVPFSITKTARDKDLFYLINPINFIDWLLYSLKDNF